MAVTGSTLLDRVPVEQISYQAKQISLAHVFLTCLAALFFAVGWLPGRLANGIVWAGVAVKVGWQEGRRPHAAPAVEPERL